MKNSTSILVGSLLLFLSAQQLPAPILEENPTPAPEQTPKPKVKRSPKPKAIAEDVDKTAAQRTRAAVATPTPIRDRFDGAWVGTLNNLPFAGNVEFTLFVSGSGTSVIEKSVNFGSNTFQSNCDGNTMRWETGSSWTLTPNPDGQTALITCNNAGFFGVGAFSLSTIFRRTTVSQVSTPVATSSTKTMPVAKPVPDKPGFVYNPFDPNSRVLLDVRGKASGTKLIEPKSGKLFVVP
jgi:hypothetical protein